jgi:hypothetical protein
MATATKKKRGGKRANSKSAAARAYMATHPDAGPTAVSNALKTKGIQISAAHVSNIKAADARKGRKTAGGAASNGVSRGRPGRRGRKPAAGDAVSLSQLLEARKFAAQVGGVERAVGLLHSLAKLQ